jgi:phage terminase large subunit GpA-like protein
LYNCSENGANQRRACEHEHRYLAARRGCLRPPPGVRFILSGVDVLKRRVYRRRRVTIRN